MVVSFFLILLLNGSWTCFSNNKKTFCEKAKKSQSNIVEYNLAVITNKKVSNTGFMKMILLWISFKARLTEKYLKLNYQSDEYLICSSVVCYTRKFQ